jgi:hypothetical protein
MITMPRPTREVVPEPTREVVRRHQSKADHVERVQHPTPSSSSSRVQRGGADSGGESARAGMQPVGVGLPGAAEHEVQ